MNTNMMELNLNEMETVNGASWSSFWNGVGCGVMPGGGIGAVIGACGSPRSGSGGHHRNPRA